MYIFKEKIFMTFEMLLYSLYMYITNKKLEDNNNSLFACLH